MDAISNKGLVQSLKEAAGSGQSGVVLTSRVSIMPVVLGDLLTELLESKPPSAQVQVLVLIKDERVRKFINRLDLDYLRSKGIVLKAESSQASVEKELIAFRSALFRGQDPPQTFVFAPMQSVSRGVDFAGIGPIFAFGFLSGSKRKGRGFALVRLRDASKSLFSNGLLSGKGQGKVEKVVYLQKELREKVAELYSQNLMAV